MGKRGYKPSAKSLVVLQYNPTGEEVHVTRLDQGYKKGLTINLKAGTWSWRHYQDQRIGQAREINQDTEGIIGVYDRSKVSHLDQMVQDTKNTPVEDAVGFGRYGQI